MAMWNGNGVRQWENESQNSGGSIFKLSHPSHSMIVSSNISPSLAFHCVSGFQFYTRVNSSFFLSTGYFFTGPAPKVLSVEDCKNKKKESEANFLGGTSKKTTLFKL